MENKKQIIEIADIFRDKRHDFLTENTLCAVQQKAMEDIIACRTSELGGHTLSCNHCGHKVRSYNSCRNRNCPKCQYIKRMQWVDKLAADLPPGKTFSHCFHNTRVSAQTVLYQSEDCLFLALQSSRTNTDAMCQKHALFRRRGRSCCPVTHLGSNNDLSPAYSYHCSCRRSIR